MPESLSPDSPAVCGAYVADGLTLAEHAGLGCRICEATYRALTDPPEPGNEPPADGEDVPEKLA